MGWVSRAYPHMKISRRIALIILKALFYRHMCSPYNPKLDFNLSKFTSGHNKCNVHLYNVAVKSRDLQIVKKIFL